MRAFSFHRLSELVTSFETRGGLLQFYSGFLGLSRFLKCILNTWKIPDNA